MTHSFVSPGRADCEGLEPAPNDLDGRDVCCRWIHCVLAARIRRAASAGNERGGSRDWQHEQKGALRLCMP